MTTSICDGKYTISSLHNDSIGLPVDLPNLPEIVEVDGLTLYRKSSFHVTLFPVGKLIEKYDIGIAHFSEKISAYLCEFIKANRIELVGFRDELRIVAENERRSLIVMCEISNINKFYDHINKKCALKLEYPPTHVTLYTLQPDKGIYLTDLREIETLSKPIENPGIIIDR